MFPWQPDQGQDVTLFHWLNLLPYANEACASLQTLALVCICIISTFAGRKVGHVRERRGRKKEFGFEKKKKKNDLPKNRCRQRQPCFFIPENTSSDNQSLTQKKCAYVVARSAKNALCVNEVDTLQPCHKRHEVHKKPNISYCQR